MSCILQSIWTKLRTIFRVGGSLVCSSVIHLDGICMTSIREVNFRRSMGVVVGVSVDEARDMCKLAKTNNFSYDPKEETKERKKKQTM